MKPVNCPLCGHETRVATYDALFYVECRECKGAFGPLAYPKKAAIETWNAQCAEMKEEKPGR